MKLRLIALLSLSIAGCAVASEDVEGVMPSKKTDGGITDTGGLEDEDTGSSAGEDTGSTSTTDSDTPSSDSGSSSSDSGSSSVDSGSSMMDTGTPAMDTGGGGTPCGMVGPAECTSAMSLGSISGDTGSGVRTATGTTSKFLRITVTEDDSSVFSSKDPRARITLSSTGGNFDLYTYLGKSKDDGGGVECSTIRASSTNPTGDDVVALQWNDNRPIGGHDDTRVISIEVRATMPDCAGASWTLTVAGNK